MLRHFLKELNKSANDAKKNKIQRIIAVLPEPGEEVVVATEGVSEAVSLTGGGTEADPYIISTDAELAFLAERVNADWQKRAQFVQGQF